MPIAIARWVLPVPGGPSSTTLSFACRKSSWPRCSTTWRLTERWKVKSNSSRVLRAGKRAALMRPSRAPALPAKALELALVGRVGEHEPAREEAAVAAGKLTGVERPRCDLA